VAAPTSSPDPSNTVTVNSPARTQQSASMIGVALGGLTLSTPLRARGVESVEFLRAFEGDDFIGRVTFPATRRYSESIGVASWSDHPRVLIVMR